MSQILHQYVIYEEPKDYPGQFVVREWDIHPGKASPGRLVSVTDTIEAARATLPPGLILMPTFAEDDPVIAEVWM